MGWLLPSPWGTTLKVGVRFGRDSTWKGANVDASDGSAMRSRSMPEMEIRGNPGAVDGHA